MNDDRAQDALTLAEDVLAAAMRDGVTEAEALVMTEDSALTRFANSRDPPERRRDQRHDQPAGGDRQAGRRRVVGPDRRRGRRAVSPRMRWRSPGWSRNSTTGVGSPARRRSTTCRGIQPDDSGASPEFRADAARAVIGAADDAGVVAYGSFATSLESIAVANSNGVARPVHERPRSSSRSRWGRAAAPVTRRPRQWTLPPSMRPRLDAKPPKRPGDVGRGVDRARRLPRRARGIRGRGPARHARVSRVLGLAVQEGRSFAEPGRRIGSDLVTIVDDGHDPAGLPLWFDFEGVAKQRVVARRGGDLPGRRLRRPDGGTGRRRPRPGTACRPRTPTGRFR